MFMSVSPSRPARADISLRPVHDGHYAGARGRGMLCQYTFQQDLPRTIRSVLHGCERTIIMTETAGMGWTGGQKAGGDIAPALARGAVAWR